MNKRVAIGAALAVVGLIALIGIGILVADGDDRRVGGLVASGGTNPWVLESGGTRIGVLASLEGCRMRGSVVESLSVDEQGDPVREKGLGAELAMVPCVLRFDSRMHGSLWTWIQSMLDGTTQRKDLTLSRVNSPANDVMTRIEVQDGLISRLAFPRLEKSGPTGTSSGSPVAIFELTVAPDQLTKTEFGSSGPSMSAHPGSATPVRANGFRLAMQGLADLQLVPAVVEPIVVTRQLVEQTGGVWRYSAGRVEVGDLEVALASATAQQADVVQDVDQWFEEFVIEGDNGPSDEKAGMLELLDPNTNSPVLTLNLTGIGIFDALGPVEPLNSGRKGYRFYFDGLAFALSPAANPPPPAPPTSPPPPPPTTAPPPPPPPPPTTAPPPPPPPPTETGESVAAPKELSARLRSASEAELQWNPVEKVEGYVILMALEPGGEYTEVARSTEPSALVSKLEGGPPYYFVVRAYVGETQSENSPEAEATG
jgi:hypothetical protein